VKIQRPAWHRGIHHDGSEKFVSRLYPALNEKLTIRLRCGQDAPIREIYLRTAPDGEQHLTPMRLSEKDATFGYWEGALTIAEPVVHYRFMLLCDDGVWYYNGLGPSAGVPVDHFDFRILADYSAPAWLSLAVFYQIFPDRFDNANPGLDPGPEDYNFPGGQAATYPWGAPPPADQPMPLVFYGGDLAGVARRLPYLQQLGVNALYLNPIFAANSNHRYDVTDYEQVDPHLGGNEALVALRNELTGYGMRYILDIVPNHCGYWHPWFQTAREDPSSLEATFFTFHDHPDDYESWLGVWTLPKLNYQSQELRERIYTGSDAVFRRWLQPPYAADGWRVDVANMLGRQGSIQLGPDVARGIRAAVKDTSPHAYLLGENFFDATNQLQGDQWDGVMNYSGFTTPLWFWLAGYREQSFSLGRTLTSAQSWSTVALYETWLSRWAAIPWAIRLQQFNLLDSHDTRRIGSIVGGDESLHRLAAIVQFTLPGVPCIYYGDEIGMLDDAMLEARSCMTWDETQWNHSLLEFYRQLIALRKDSVVLQKGGFQWLAIESDSFAFQREDKGERIIVLANRKPRPAHALPVAQGGAPDGARFTEFYGRRTIVAADGSMALPDLPAGATIWIQQPPPQD
jgi:alpha-glucosidase